MGVLITKLVELIMQDSEISKLFGSRVKKLRKQKGWSQKELAEKIGMSFQQVNKYEGGAHARRFEKLALIAESLDTTIDYLVAGDTQEAGSFNNVKLFQLFKEVESFERKDQEAAMLFIDALIVKRKVDGLASR